MNSSAKENTDGIFKTPVVMLRILVIRGPRCTCISRLRYQAPFGAGARTAVGTFGERGEGCGWGSEPSHREGRLRHPTKGLKIYL